MGRVPVAKLPDHSEGGHLQHRITDAILRPSTDRLQPRQCARAAPVRGMRVNVTGSGVHPGQHLGRCREARVFVELLQDLAKAFAVEPIVINQLVEQDDLGLDLQLSVPHRRQTLETCFDLERFQSMFQCTHERIVTCLHCVHIDMDHCEESQAVSIAPIWNQLGRFTSAQGAGIAGAASKALDEADGMKVVMAASCNTLGAAGSFEADTALFTFLVTWVNILGRDGSHLGYELLEKLVSDHSL